MSSVHAKRPSVWTYGARIQMELNQDAQYDFVVERMENGGRLELVMSKAGKVRIIKNELVVRCFKASVSLRQVCEAIAQEAETSSPVARPSSCRFQTVSIMSKKDPIEFQDAMLDQSLEKLNVVTNDLIIVDCLRLVLPSHEANSSTSCCIVC